MNQRDKDHVDYERSERSVFVGNIPYEATEDQLKDIFNEVGSVVSFRLVFDRESGKPKGYGFAEYQDQETAMSAMRNLNGRELHGRPLRVDHATSEKNRNQFSEEATNIRLPGPPIESEYGDSCPPHGAPEAISKAVASLPPEQMFELMRQMKQCIQNNPVEARNMLLQNPQLAYALLQAQVVMRIVDPEIAMKMLHRPTPATPLIPAEDPQIDVTKEGKPVSVASGIVVPGFPPPVEAVRIEPMDVGMKRNDQRFGPLQRRMDRDVVIGSDRIPVDGVIMGDRGGGVGHFDGPPPHRGMPHDQIGRPPSPERFGRGDPRQLPIPSDFPDSRRPPPPPLNRDPRSTRDRGRSSLERGGVSPHEFPGRSAAPPPERFPSHPVDPMMDVGLVDPRRAGGGGPQLPPHIAGQLQAAGAGEEDQEKANLIMQVLQLTPEQIKLLPEDQRKNILALKTNFGL